MFLYRHILLTTDLSEDTNLADKTAYIMQHTKAKLSIVHVLEHTPVVYGGSEFSIPLDMNLEEHLARNIKNALAVIAERLNIPDEDQYILHGSVKKEIIELAGTLEVDLIIVGSHRHRGGLERLLGSTANAILHVAKCDVLAIRSK